MKKFALSALVLAFTGTAALAEVKPVNTVLNTKCAELVNVNGAHVSTITVAPEISPKFCFARIVGQEGSFVSLTFGERRAIFADSGQRGVFQWAGDAPNGIFEEYNSTHVADYFVVEQEGRGGVIIRRGEDRLEYARFVDIIHTM